MATDGEGVRGVAGSGTARNTAVLDLTFGVAAALLPAGVAVLAALPFIRTPALHTILDASVCQISAVLALLLWQIGMRAEQVSARLLAIAFTIVAAAEA